MLVTCWHRYLCCTVVHGSLTTDSQTQANWVAFDVNLQDLNVDVVLVLQWKCVYYATKRLRKRDCRMRKRWRSLRKCLIGMRNAVLNSKDKCSNRGFDSSLLGFKIGTLGVARVPDIDKRSSGGSFLGSTRFANATSWFCTGVEYRTGSETSRSCIWGETDSAWPSSSSLLLRLKSFRLSGRHFWFGASKSEATSRWYADSAQLQIDCECDSHGYPGAVSPAWWVLVMLKKFHLGHKIPTKLTLDLLVKCSDSRTLAVSNTAFHEWNKNEFIIQLTLLATNSVEQ